MPTGWVRRWPSGYLGPRGETVGREGRWWVGVIRTGPDGQHRVFAPTLTELWQQLGYGDGGAA